MRRFLQRLWRAGRPRPALICHLRENGPIAYEFDLFGPDPRERTDAMLSSDLWWSWRGRSRDWTHLTRVSLSAFLGDLTAGAVLLLATEGEPPHDLGDATVSQWISRFARLEPSPVSAVISLSDGRPLLFVQQHASDAVNALLDALNIDKGAAQRSSYARLGSFSVEAVAERLR